jgi:hypothetical protein
VAKEAEKRDLVVGCECDFEARGTLDTASPLVHKHGREKVTRAQVAAMARQS